MPADWMNTPLSLGRDLELQAARLSIKNLSRDDLEARLDSALVHAITFDHLLREAIRRIAELEIAEALSETIDQKHYEWAAKILQK
jgi:hypothetical protein